MKKTTLAICLLVVITLTVSARWAITGDNARQPEPLNTADTTLARDLSIESMVNQADVIATGICTDTRSVWVAQTLVTLATVSVTESLKGSETTNITVALPGGVDYNRKFPIAMTYPGAPQIRPGEDVFLFLSSSSDFSGSYTVAGFSQGKFSIVTDENGEKLVSRDLTKTALQGQNGVRRGETNSIPLLTLKDQVKGYLLF
jgi:hypothetical protein